MPATETTTQPVTAELASNGERVLVTFKYNPQFVKAVKQVPSARFVNKDHVEGPAWALNLDLPTMRKLREELGDQLAIGPRLRKWGTAQVEKERTLTDLSQAEDAKLEAMPEKGKWHDADDDKTKAFKLRPYQKADIAFMAETNVLNTNQPRAGKTIETVGAIIEAGMEWGQHLIFAPKNSLRNVWEKQIRMAYEVAGLDEPTILTGDTPDKRREAIAEAKELADDSYAFYLVVNPAMGRMTTKTKKNKRGEPEKEETLANPQLVEIEWDSITIDEFHLMGLSNPQTQGAKGMNHIAEVTQPARKYALSGTPMGGKPIKLWGALHFLNPDEFTSRWNWARHWLVINTNGYGSTIEGIMPGREVDFYNHLKPYLVRRTTREALPGLPPRVAVDVWCSMTDTQREQYIHFLTEAEWAMQDAEERGERLTATNILAQYTRLKQFADAYCEVHKTGAVDDLGIPKLKVAQTPDSGKLEQLLEKLAEENVIGTDKDTDEDLKCALVFSQFNPMVEMVAEALEAKGVPTAILGTGGAKGAKLDATKKAFQTQQPVTYRGKVIEPPRVLVMNTLAGTAMTLDRAETVHILDETWVPDNQEQAEGRIIPTTPEAMARPSMGVYYYRTRGSIEEYVQKLVADKQLNNKTILDLRRRMARDIQQAEEEGE